MAPKSKKVEGQKTDARQTVLDKALEDITKRFLERHLQFHRRSRDSV